jgi:hypothetical protein
MENLASHLQPVTLPLPERGRSTRFRVGTLELVLETVRGSTSLLCLDGQQTRSWSLGLPRNGELRVLCRAPRLPLLVEPRDPLVLAPRGRLRGYVQVPLVPTIVWQSDLCVETVAELLPSTLGAEWDETTGGCVQRCSSPFTTKLPPAGVEPRAIVPVVIANGSDRMQGPVALPLQINDRELRPLRGLAIAAPRRLCVGSDGQVAPGAQRRQWEASA